MRGIWSVAAMAGVAVGLFAPAGAYAAWSPSVDLSAAGPGAFQDVDSDQSPNGRALALWTYLPNPDSERGGRVFAAVASRTGGFGRARSRAMAPIEQRFFRGAMADSGHALIVFQEAVRRRGRTIRRIRAIHVMPSGALSAAVTLSPAGVDALTPQVSELPRSRFVVGWRTSTGVVQAAKFRATGAREGPVRTIARGARSDDPRSTVVVASAGENVVLAWNAPGASRLSLWPRGGRPSASRSLGRGTHDVDVQGAGSTFVVSTITIANDRSTGSLRRWRATGPLESAATGYPLGDTATDAPEVAIGTRGNALAVWDTFLANPPSGSGRFVSTVAVGPPPATWGPVQPLPDEGNDIIRVPAEPAAVNARGDAVVAYSAEGSNTDRRLRATVRPGGGAFGPVTTLTLGDSPTVVLRANGNAIVVFLRDVGSSNAVATAAYTP
jgi:hypothetical protein